MSGATSKPLRLGIRTSRITTSGLKHCALSIASRLVRCLGASSQPAHFSRIEAHFLPDCLVIVSYDMRRVPIFE